MFGFPARERRLTITVLAMLLLVAVGIALFVAMFLVKDDTTRDLLVRRGFVGWIGVMMFWSAAYRGLVVAERSRRRRWHRTFAVFLLAGGAYLLVVAFRGS